MSAAHVDVAPLRLTPELVAELKAWTAANLKARRAYYALPNAVTRKIFKGSW